MRLKEEQIAGLANRIFRNLSRATLIESKGSEATIQTAIADTLLRFVTTARAVEEEVRKLMAQYANQMQSGEIDTQKMYGLIKKQVAQKRHFELAPEDQVSVLAHQIQDKLYQDDLVDYPEEEKALKSIKETLRETLAADELLGDKIRAKIRSLKRGVTEGSGEWTILYEKYLAEELAKRGL